MEKLSLTCEQCGSVDVELIGDNLAKCNHCETKFMIQNEEESAQEETTRPEPTIIEFGVKPTVEVDLKEFERKSLVKIFLSKDTAIDKIKNAISSEETKVEGPFENINKYALTRVDYYGTLTVDVGYRYPFVDKDSDKDEDFRWQPYEKSFDTSHSAVVSVDYGRQIYSYSPATKDIVNGYLKGEVGADAFCDINELDPDYVKSNAQVIKKAIDDNFQDLCDGIIYEAGLPGDKQRFVSYKATHDMRSAVIVAEKEYVLSYGTMEAVQSCNNEYINIKGNTNYCSTDSLSRAGVSKEEQEYYKSKATEMQTETEKKYHQACAKAEEQKKKLKATYKKMILPIVLGIIICMVSGWFDGFISTLGKIIGAIVFLGAIAFPFKGYDFNLANSISNLKQAIRDEQKENPKPTKELLYKADKLNEVLAQRGLEPASDEEILSYAAGYKNYDL